MQGESTPIDLVNYIYHPHYDDIRREKQKILQTIDPITHEGADQKVEDSLNAYLGLLKQGKSYNATMRNKKEFTNVENLGNNLRNLDIDEHDSNFPKDKFDLRKNIDKGDFFDDIARKQSEAAGLIRPLQAQPSHSEKDGKSLWDTNVDPGADNDRYAAIKSMGRSGR